MNVITPGNSPFSSRPPFECSCTFFGCCVVFELSELLLFSLWVLASALFLLYFFLISSSIFAFNAAISFDWFCLYVSGAFLVGDLGLILKCFEVKDWSFCCCAAFTSSVCIMVNIVRRCLYYYLQCLLMLASSYLALLWFMMFVDFSHYKVCALNFFKLLKFSLLEDSFYSFFISGNRFLNLFNLFFPHVLF